MENYNVSIMIYAIAYDYVAFYKVNKKSKTVEIHRIFNSKQNIENLL